MKKYFVIFLFFVALLPAFAQKKMQNLPFFDQKPIRWGFVLGTSFMNFGVMNSDIIDENGERWFSQISEINPGFNVGVITNLRLAKYFDYRFTPGISLGQRDLQFVNDQGVRRDNPVAIKSAYIVMPMSVRYKAVRDGNVRPFMAIGTNVAFDLARSKKEDILLKPMDIALEFSLGSDYYFEQFRFGVELKFSLGLNNILEVNRDDVGNYDPKFTQSVENLKSRIFTIAFNFE